DPVVVGVADGDEGRARRLGLGHGHLIGPRADDQAEAVVAVHGRGGRELADDADVRPRVDLADGEQVEVGMQPGDAVRVDPAEVADRENIGGHRGVGRRDAEVLKRPCAKLAQALDGEVADVVGHRCPRCGDRRPPFIVPTTRPTPARLCPRDLLDRGVPSRPRRGSVFVCATANPERSTKMTRMSRLVWGLPITVAIIAAGVFWTQRGESAPEQNAGNQPKPGELKPAVSLPISQVILFNSGVGHFTRAGEVEVDARVDLTFPEQDINDLIKSMTLRDLSRGGWVQSVTYDSHDPIDRTLQSFAINLNNSPPLANILTQARGEQVEVTLVNTAKITSPAT